VSRASRFLDALRETLKDNAPMMRSTSVDDALLVRAVSKAEQAAESALGASQAAGAASAQQRGTLDAAVDAVRQLFTRAREARSSLALSRESLEQIRLVALNAGLEGARLGDPTGKPLVLVADDVRNHVTRVLAALDAHTGVLDQMDRERDKLREQVEGAQARSADLARELLQVQAAQRDVSSAMSDVSSRVKQVTETDPETAALLADASDHARALLGALTKLAEGPRRSPVLRALSPSLGPLAKLLREQYRGDPDGAP